MKYFLYFILIISLSSCFTGSLLEKAKKEKKYETIDQITYATIDSAGNALFVIRKVNSKKDYSFTINVDTLYKRYKASSQLNLIFTPEERQQNGHVIGLFYKDDLPKSYEKPLLIFVERKALHELRDDALAAKHGRYIDAEIYSANHYMPVFQSDTMQASWNSQKYMTIVFRDQAQGELRKQALDRTFVIGIESKRKRNVRYLLTPLTVAADVATAPLQLLVLVFIQFIKM